MVIRVVVLLATLVAAGCGGGCSPEEGKPCRCGAPHCGPPPGCVTPPAVLVREEEE